MKGDAMGIPKLGETVGTISPLVGGFWKIKTVEKKPAGPGRRAVRRAVVEIVDGVGDSVRVEFGGATAYKLARLLNQAADVVEHTPHE
jgi:hypothetical protein